MEKAKRPLLCRLGFHQMYLDSAMYSSVSRCERCPKVDSEAAEKRLAHERQLWYEVDKESSFDDQRGWVAERMHEAPQEF